MEKCCILSYWYDQKLKLFCIYSKSSYRKCRVIFSEVRDIIRIIKVSIDALEN